MPAFKDEVLVAVDQRPPPARRPAPEKERDRWSLRRHRRNGLPMGMQIVGRNRGELAVLQLAHAYDEATGWVRRKPPPLA